MGKEGVKADVLCVGGGIAGLMAAIPADEIGTSVVVADKSNPLHSAKGGARNDDLLCYIPEAHGSDIDGFIQEAIAGTQLADPIRAGPGQKTARTYLNLTSDVVKLWDRWGDVPAWSTKTSSAGRLYPPCAFSPYLTPLRNAERLHLAPSTQSLPGRRPLDDRGTRLSTAARVSPRKS
ncbi:MAG: FAD-binding protein [Chloroflexi bacterium]|nr:FAD-binding protein [Chloroflexota bacterium]